MRKFIEQARGREMSEKRYVENCEIRPGAKNSICFTCDRPITRKPNQAWRDVKIVTDEERIDCFRGNDNVRFHHFNCIQHPTIEAEEREVGK